MAKRRHIRTGRKPSGRPPGSRNVLPRGTVLALRGAAVARRRLGAAEDPEAMAVLETVASRIADVLCEKVHPLQAPHVLKAAAMLAEAVGGKVTVLAVEGGPIRIQLATTRSAS